jgi:hypothetical protein
MLIENNIEDAIDFFHMDALSSAVALKINCDLQLTLMASSLYRLPAVRVGNGYELDAHPVQPVQVDVGRQLGVEDELLGQAAGPLLPSSWRTSATSATRGRG